MNSTLQCLSNIPELREYFITNAYTHDIHPHAPMKGQLATEFGDLLTKMWNTTLDTVSPDAFKSIVGKWAPQFKGYRQHDSQEFLRFLLDGLHEELNRVKIKPPYTELKDIPDEAVSDQALRWWKNYVDRFDSTISDIFLGQLKSTVKCLSCQHVSHSFDPFMDVSLPIPQTVQSIYRLFTRIYNRLQANRSLLLTVQWHCLIV